MLTKEFIKRVKEIDSQWEIELILENWLTIKNAYGERLMWLDDNRRYIFDNHYYDFKQLPEDKREQLFKIATEYAATPIEERKVKLLETELAILENVTNIYYLARDEDGGLYMYVTKPSKLLDYWDPEGCSVVKLNPALFSFVKWEDDEPTKVSDLLGVN